MLFFLSFLSISYTYAQRSNIDSVTVLTGVEIHAARSGQYAIGYKRESIDSLVLSQARSENLGELLFKNTSLYFKIYGQGGMSTLCFRGTTSSQSGVFWNGFNIEGRSSSIVDYSLLPAFFFNKVDVLYGGAASLFGSGNIGGSIHLGQQMAFNEGFSMDAGLSFGSFGEVGPQLKISLSNRKWSSTTSLLYHHIENDFPYTYAGTTKYLTHAAIESKALYQQLDHRFNNKHILNFSLWLQQDDRELSAPMTGSSSIENRTDQSFRFSSRWKADYYEGFTVSAGLALVHDYLHYLNVSQHSAQILVNSKIYNDVLMAEANAEKRLGKYWDLYVQLSFEQAQTDVNSFGGTNKQLDGGVRVSIKRAFWHDKWNAAFHIRQEWAENYSIPFCPSLGIEGKIGRFVKIFANGSDNFRIPSLNDRFWVPGGNQDLKPESSRNGECGIQYSYVANSVFLIEPKLTSFVSLINDQIVWVPNGQLWQAENVQRVFIRGLELKIASVYSFRKCKLNFSAEYSFVSSVNQDKYLPNDASVGKQQIYTPKNRAVASLGLNNKVFNFTVKSSYTGITYTTRDNSAQMPAYLLFDFMAAYQSSWKALKGIEIGVEFDNIFNQQYQLIQYYPAAGRQFRVHLNWRFNSKN
ncbi:MAG: TonB-dependent receptor [Bacteroidota bacterium]